MIRTLPNKKSYIISYNIFIILYFIVLFTPLIVVSILAFNNSMFTSLPWRGFTLDWFLGKGPEKIGLIHDTRNLNGIFSSFKVALCVTFITLIIGTLAAFLIEQEEFLFKKFVYFLIIAPLVVPGVILGISILSASNSLGFFIEQKFEIDFRIGSPGFWLVVLGQSTFITPFVFLVIISRLKKFDRGLEEAAYDLGASRFEVIWYITMKYLRPAHIGGAAVAFLLSFDNFNTTLFLVGSEPTMPIVLFTQVRDGSTPVVNAVSFLIIIFVSLLALLNFYFSSRAKKAAKQ
jgi:spermidine/putrescine transport system permease protein